jgi:hypothetical protein
MFISFLWVIWIWILIPVQRHLPQHVRRGQALVPVLFHPHRRLIIRGGADA